jgi:hypothetical protein
MMIKQLKLFLLFWIAMLLASTVSAGLDDLNLFHQAEDTQDSMVWPLLPNESVASLAAKFYPKNTAMQRKFIEKTKRLNQESKTVLDPNTGSESITAIVIPNLESLSINAGVIKPSRKTASNKALQLSYNIKSTAEKATASIQNIPARLVEEYENLVERNAFLKEEIAKLNERLVFLQNKLGELKLVLDRTLSLPPKKTFKNLNTEKAPVTTQNTALQNKPEKAVINVENATPASFFNLTNQLLWLSILGVGLLLALSSYLYKKYRERKYLELVNAISLQKQATTYSATVIEESLPDEVLLPATTINKDTVLEEQTDKSVLQEAKTLMSRGLVDDAIGHLKWAIRAKPKTSINFWLYLLDIFRKQNQKDEFEKYAFEMHQTFNVMTPLWEERSVAMIVPQSLEEFPYIMKLLTDKWPNQKIGNYLHKLISDNRSGERSGFSQSVIEEILLLIDILETREADEASA